MKKLITCVFIGLISQLSSTTYASTTTGTATLTKISENSTSQQNVRKLQDGRDAQKEVTEPNEVADIIKTNTPYPLIHDDSNGHFTAKVGKHTCSMIAKYSRHAQKSYQDTSQQTLEYKISGKCDEGSTFVGTGYFETSAENSIEFSGIFTDTRGKKKLVAGHTANL